MAIGLTVVDELAATGDPFRVALVAFVVFHEIVELPPPKERDVGFALMAAVGAVLLTSNRLAPISVEPDWGRGAP